MQAYIQNQLNLYEGNPLGYSNLPYVPEVNLNQPLIYHQTRNLFDAYFPPLHTLGNYDTKKNKKLVLLSLEPHKKVRIHNDNIDLSCDFLLQVYALKNLTINNVLDANAYRQQNLNHQLYMDYQLDYFNTFPALFRNQGMDLYPDAYNHTYWRYIAHIAKGYLNLPGFLNNEPIRENGWQSLSDGLIELPIFPMSAPNHPNVGFNASIAAMLWNRLELIRPSCVISLARSHENEILGYMGINNPPVEERVVCEQKIRIFYVNHLGRNFKLITGVALAAHVAWGGLNGKYNYAYQLGQIAQE